MSPAGIPSIDLSTVAVSSALAGMLPPELMTRYRVIPFDMRGSRLAVAMEDPTNTLAQDVVKSLTGCEIDVFSVDPGALAMALRRLSQVGDAPICKELAVHHANGEGKVPELVDMLVEMAVKHRASDIHIEPQTQGLFVRFRVDGILRTVHMFPRRLLAPMIARVKVLATMDITEKRLPQDGQIIAAAAGREVDLRVSTLPAKYGEKVVIRVLDKSSSAIDLGQIGMPAALQSQFEIMTDRPQGMVLVTGPTGSGKTTTLYAAIKRLRSPMRNIVTLENPVEYELLSETADESGVTQVQVNPKIGLTFASGLRACLRQDPDVIMVGEVRDRETAEVAMQASMTGHLVFSTLHTNSACETVARLRDIGIDPWLIASTLTGVIAQRLVRVLCPECREGYEPPQRLVESLFPKRDPSKKVTLFRPKGCEKCQGSGYFGRRGIFEMLVLDDDIRRAIQANEPVDTFVRLATSKGMVPLRQSGLDLVYEGVTSTEEVFRSTVL